eukprot:ctg_392.g244
MNSSDEIADAIFGHVRVRDPIRESKRTGRGAQACPNSRRLSPDGSARSATLALVCSLCVSPSTGETVCVLDTLPLLPFSLTVLMFRVNVLASLAPRWRRELWETVRSTGTSAMHRLGVAALLLTILLGVSTFLAMIIYWRQEAGGSWSDARNVSVRDRVRRLRRQRRIDWSACHVLLTGGSRGIGLEVAKLLVSGAREAGGMAPARLTIVGRNTQRLEEAKTTLELLAQDRCQSGGTVVHAAAADVSQTAEVERLFREAPRPFDVVICCAGGARPGHFEAFTAQDFSDQMAQNFYSAAWWRRRLSGSGSRTR